MYLAAEMYYVSRKTQHEIAAELGVSRPMVSRLLSQAEKEGIVQITVVNPFENLNLLGEELKSFLGLEVVVVAPGVGGSPLQMRRRLGMTAARYLLSSLGSGDRLGIGWGRTLYEVAESLEPHPEFNLSVVPLMGGLGQITPSFQVNSLARTFSEKLGGRWDALYVPAIIEDPDTRAALFASRDVTQITRLWEALDVVVVGIGNVTIGDEVHMLFADYVDDHSMESLAQQQAAGDICMRFFDMNGKPVQKGLAGVTSIELELLRKAPRRIGVAGGKEKVEAIIGAARGGFINILVTDEAAARTILEHNNGTTWQGSV
jgi:deoxyribonucleoside regulator